MPPWILNLKDWLAALVDWLLALPKEVVGPLIATCSGALIAFIGVNLQLRHNARQEDKKRLHELRKNELLQLAQLIPVGKVVITAMTGVRFSYEDYRKEVQAAIALANRAVAIATMPTLEALDALTDHYQNAFIELVAVRVPLDKLNTQIDRLENSLKEIQQQRDQMWKFSEDRFGTLTEAMSTYVHSRLEHLDAEEKEDSAMLERLMLEQRKHLLQIVSLSVRHLATYEGLQSQVNINIRKEMNLTIDDTAYAALVNRGTARTQERVSAFLKSLEKQGSELDVTEKAP